MHIYVYIHTSLFLYISHINIRTAIILQMQTYVQLQSELLSIFSMLVSAWRCHTFSLSSATSSSTTTAWHIMTVLLQAISCSRLRMLVGTFNLQLQRDDVQRCCLDIHFVTVSAAMLHNTCLHLRVSVLLLHYARNVVMSWWQFKVGCLWGFTRCAAYKIGMACLGRLKVTCLVSFPKRNVIKQKYTALYKAKSFSHMCKH